MQLGVSGIFLALFGLLARGTLRLAREFQELKEANTKRESMLEEGLIYWRTIAEQLLNITSRATTVASVATFAVPPRVQQPTGVEYQQWREQMEHDLRRRDRDNEEAT